MRRLFRAVGSAPLFLQILALLLVSLLAAQLLTAAVIVFLPPPEPEVFGMRDVAAALQGGTVPDRLSRSVAAAAPVSGVWPRRSAVVEAFADIRAQELAVLLRVDPERVRLINVRRSRLFAPLIRFNQGRERGPHSRHGPGIGRPGLGGGAYGRPPATGRGFGPMREGVLFGDFRASLHRADGAWVTVRPRTSGPAIWRQRMLIWLFGCAVLFAPLAYLFARRLTSPITTFAEAADRLGRNPRAAPITLTGPTEVRVAVTAFNRMQERLRRYVDDRTAMIGAVAHDMRTPLTRMRFLLEARPEDVRDKMEREIDEMDAMIAATLAFVKDTAATGERVRLDLGALVESVSADMVEGGAPITYHHCSRLLVSGDPLALKRLFGNLLTNAVKFAGAAEISADVEGADAMITVTDRGPGLADADLDRAFEPFFRSESSRSRETGGIGLGLAVVRSVARAHGGDAVLRNRDGGGLSCTVTIPLDDLTSTV